MTQYRLSDSSLFRMLFTSRLPHARAMLTSHRNNMRSDRHIAVFGSTSSNRRWSLAFARAIAPRKHLCVLPTRTRPSLFGSD